MAHAGGLGNVSILSHSTPWSLEGGISAGRVPRSCAPESISPKQQEGAPDPSLPAKTNDMYGFGVIAWEVRTGSFVSIVRLAHSKQVLTGRPPFADMTEIAATYSMLSGARPPRPNHHEISDRVWYMIERCWDNVPLKRMSIGEVVSLLEAELRHTSDSCTSSRA
jgi:hypothetical protein